MTLLSENPSNPNARYSEEITTSEVANSGAGLIAKAESIYAGCDFSAFQGSAM